MFTRRTALFLILFAAVGAAGCAKKTPLADEHKDFAGKWVAADGTFVQIYLDGGGDFKMSSSNVTGGNATIQGDKLTIGLGPIDKTFSIDEKPKQDGDAWTMKLDGIAYKKE